MSLSGKSEIPFGVSILFALSMINAITQLIVCFVTVTGLALLPLVLLYMTCCFKMLSGSRTCLKILLAFTAVTSITQIAFLLVYLVSSMSSYVAELFMRSQLLNYIGLCLVMLSMIGGFIPSFTLMIFTVPFGGVPSGPVKVPRALIYLRILMPIIVILAINLVVYLIIRSKQVREYFNL